MWSGPCLWRRPALREWHVRVRCHFVSDWLLQWSRVRAGDDVGQLRRKRRRLSELRSTGLHQPHVRELHAGQLSQRLLSERHVPAWKRRHRVWLWSGGLLGVQSNHRERVLWRHVSVRHGSGLQPRSTVPEWRLCVRLDVLPVGVLRWHHLRHLDDRGSMRSERRRLYELRSSSGPLHGRRLRVRLRRGVRGRPALPLRKLRL